MDEMEDYTNDPLYQQPDRTPTPKKKEGTRETEKGSLQSYWAAGKTGFLFLKPPKLP